MRMRKTRGFTLIELLVVMAIIIALASLLIAALFPQKRKAMVKNSQALIEKVKTALDQYYSEFHDYPPDGYDVEPGWTVDASDATGSTGGGVKLKCGATGKTLSFRGSGSLIYFLCYPIVNVYSIGADSGIVDPRNLRQNACNKGAAYLSTLKREEYSVHHWDQDFDPVPVPGSAAYKDEWCRGEIVDAFLFPIHYDKVGSTALNPDGTVKSGDRNFQADRFSGTKGRNAHPDRTFYDRYVTQLFEASSGGQLPNTEDVCSESGKPHNPSGGTGGVVHADPRSPQQTDGCYIDGNARPRNQGGVDIWSHGGTWANGINSITNWK